MDLNKYLNNVAPSEPQYSKEEYAAMKKTEREAVWVQVDARMGEVLADASTLQGFLDFMSQCRNSLPNQLLLSGQNADITDARTFQQWKDAGRHIRTGEEGYTAIVGQVYENNGRKASGYNIGKVFDITQTRGRPVPPPAEYQVDELIAASIESSPVPIQISDSLPDGIQTQYVPKNRTIYVRNGMDAGTTLCAIVRECAQADFHKDYTYNRQAYAAPSYCAAYINNVGFWDSIPLWAVTLIGGLLITVLSFTMILTVYGRMFSLWMYAAIAPIPLSTFAGEPTSSVGKNFIRSYAGVCLQGMVIALSCIIFSAISSSPPAVDTGASVVTAVWTYVGELAFNLLVLVGAIKGCDRIVKEIMGL